MDLININKKNSKPDRLVEIKWSNRYFENPNELKSVAFFCNENKLNLALCTTIDKTGMKEYKGIKIQYIPASVYAYNVGRNTFESLK